MKGAPAAAEAPAEVPDAEAPAAIAPADHCQQAAEDLARMKLLPKQDGRQHHDDRGGGVEKGGGGRYFGHFDGVCVTESKE